LWHQIQKRGKFKAGGLDGWRSSEVLDLPPAIVSRFARFFTVIEAGAEWPEATVAVPNPILAKSSTKRAPVDVRVLGLMSVWVSEWAKLRYHEIQPWRDNWTLPNMMGAKKGCTIADLAWPLQLRLEHANTFELKNGGCLADRKQCFDRIVPELALALLERAGCPAPLLRARRNFNSSVNFRFRIGNSHSVPMLRPNGAIQGSVWSLDECTIIMRCWMLAQETAARVDTLTLMDDSTSASFSEDPAPRVLASLEHSVEFDTDSGQMLSPPKTYLWASHPETKKKLDNLFIYGHKLTVVDSARLVGFSMSFALSVNSRRIDGAHTALLDKRLSSTTAPLLKIAQAPVGLEDRALLIESVAASRVNVGLSIGFYGDAAAKI